MNTLQRAMEALLKRELRTSKLRCLGRSGGGCINDGKTYETGEGKVFVKYNSDEKAKTMFEGEELSLEAILDTHTIRVPKPIKVLKHPEGEGWLFIMEHLEMRGVHKYQKELGEQLARLHLHNPTRIQQEQSSSSRVSSSSDREEGGERAEERGARGGVEQFGFPVTTCCGFIPLVNDWHGDWVEFYIRQRLKVQVDLVEKEYRDREVRELWPQLQRRIPSFFAGVDVKPSLLHGDLWSGNIAETDSGPGLIFDPACFYGHHEFELAITAMFGGFTKQFYDSYHKLIPKAPGFSTRHKLYTLFHYLNHWNHFGSGYRHQSIALMRELVS